MLRKRVTYGNTDYLLGGHAYEETVSRGTVAPLTLTNMWGTNAHILIDVDKGNQPDQRTGRQLVLKGTRIALMVENWDVATPTQSTQPNMSGCWVRFWVVGMRKPEAADGEDWYQTSTGTINYGLIGDMPTERMRRPLSRDYKVLVCKTMYLGGSANAGAVNSRKLMSIYINWKRQKFRWQSNGADTSDIMPHIRMYFEIIPDIQQAVPSNLYVNTYKKHYFAG